MQLPRKLEKAIMKALPAGLLVASLAAPAAAALPARHAAANEADADAGLVFHPVPACTFASTRHDERLAGAPLMAPETRSYRLRGALTDLSSQGGSATGCGIPEMAAAVVISVVSADASGEGTVHLYDQGGSPSGSGLLDLPASGADIGNLTTLRLCAGDCPEADLTVSLQADGGGGSTHLRLDVLGYFAPAETSGSRAGGLGEPSRASAATTADPTVAATAIDPATHLAEIRLFSGNTEPRGWLFADGRLLAIRGNTELFGVLGNTYGGDGRTTFALPDLRGRIPMGVGAGPGLTNRRIGQEPGSEGVILDVTQLPSHDHTLRATNSSATQTQPAGNILATASTTQYLNATTSVLMGSDSVGSTGSNAPHPVVQPAQVLRFIIAVDPQIVTSGVTAPSPEPGEEGAASTVAASAETHAETPLPPKATRVDRHSGLQFTSGGVDYIGLQLLEHEDGIGTIWLAIPKNHDLESGPVTPRIVLAPDVVTPL